MAVSKRSVKIAGHPSSVTLEDEFWSALKTIAQARSLSLNALITEIDAQRSESQENLSSALRVYILKSFQNANE